MDNTDQILAELKKITELLTPKPPPPPTAKPKGIIKEFRAFLSQYKVLGMAVAFILAIYLGLLIQAMVTDLIMPVIQYATPAGVSWQSIAVGPFLFGDFINAVITFAIVAFVIFMIVKISDSMPKIKRKRSA
jgi:large conductance mechanosensitive channel